MKKATIIKGLVMSTVLVTVGGVRGLAADNESTTVGKIQFTQQSETSEGTVTLPETEDKEIIPETGGSTKGPLRLTHVPDFNFGQLEIASETLIGDALLETYLDKGQTVPHDISHFVQVEDVRGTKNGWKLTVSASQFMPTKRINQPLENSHIVLQQGKLSNTRLSEVELGAAVTPFTKGLALKNDDQALTLLATNPGENTDSSKTSLVFNDSYSKNDPAAGSSTVQVGTATKQANPGVQLMAVGTDQKIKNETYTAVITWTLQDVK